MMQQIRHAQYGPAIYLRLNLGVANLDAMHDNYSNIADAFQTI